MENQGIPVTCKQDILNNKTEVPSHVRGDLIVLDLWFLTFSMSVSLTRMRRYDGGGLS